MKIKIGDREYPAVDHDSAELLHLMELQQQAMDLVPGGLGLSALDRMRREGRRYAGEMKTFQAARERGEDAEEPLIPDAALTMMAVTIFLSRRAAGDVVSFRDALRVGMSAVVQIPELTDRAAGDDESDPQTPGSGGPATADDAAPEATPRATRSRTSASRSASGSRSSATGGRRSARGTSSTSS